MDTKKCNDCKQDKPISAFGRDKSQRDGLRAICRTCNSLRTKMHLKGSPIHTRPAVIDPEKGLKKCAKCGEWRPFSSFSKSVHHSTGLKPHCKLCAQLGAANIKEKRKTHPEARVCSKCGQLKPAEEFPKHIYSLDGLASQCKSCTSAYQREHQKMSVSPSVEMVEKTCARCRLTKPIVAFSRDAHSKDGISRMCKACHKEIYQKVKATPKVIPAEKVCPTCHTLKPAKAFYKTSGRLDGLTTQCKVCMRAYQNSEAGRLAKRKVRERRERQERAAQTTLSVEQWQGLIDICDNTCPRCGSPFTVTLTPTVDHILPLSKGGDLTIRNTQPLCANCNSQKNATEIIDYRPQDKLAELLSRLNLAL